MIALLAFRNIIFRPWRSLLLFFGYGVGVGVMVVLLSIGEALLSQARDERLVGGGSITVLPQGLDVEVMKTGEWAAFISPSTTGDSSTISCSRRRVLLA